jgi:hypothetical protein
MNLQGLKVMHAYPPEMGGKRAGWVAVGDREGSTPYACVTFFTIGSDGAVCALNQDDTWTAGTIQGFSNAVSLATPLISLPQDSSDRYFPSWTMQPRGTSAVLDGDQVYHARGQGTVSWHDSPARVWRELKERLAPYEDADKVFQWLYYSYNLMVSHPDIVKRERYRNAFAVLSPSDLPELQARTLQDVAASRDLAVKIRERVKLGMPYGDNEFRQDTQALVVPSYANRWANSDTIGSKLEFVHNYYIAALNLRAAEALMVM